MILRRILAVVAIAVAILAAGRTVAQTGGYWGFDTANLDKSCKPCDDFYQFAMGGWMKANPIPPEYPTWGSFTVLLDKNQQNLRSILEAAEKANAPAGSNERKIGDFYASCMDTTSIEAAGTKPIDDEMLRIAQIKGGTDLQAEVAHLQTIGVDAMFRFGSRQDAKDSTEVIATAVQGGLGLPDKDYYLKDDEKSKSLRDTYVKHVGKMFELLGDSGDMAAVEAIDRDDGGNSDGEGFDVERGAARSEQDVSPDEAGGAEIIDAGFFVGSVLQGDGASGLRGDEYRAAGLFQGVGFAIDDDTD